MLANCNIPLKPEHPPDFSSLHINLFGAEPYNYIFICTDQKQRNRAFNFIVVNDRKK